MKLSLAIHSLDLKTEIKDRVLKGIPYAITLEELNQDKPQPSSEPTLWIYEWGHPISPSEIQKQITHRKKDHPQLLLLIMPPDTNQSTLNQGLEMSPDDAFIQPVSPLFLKLRIHQMVQLLETQSLLKLEEDRLLQCFKASVVSDLARGFCHDINNSLAVISGSAEAIAVTYETEPEQVLVGTERIAKSVNKMVDSIRTLRMFAIQNSSESPQPVEIDKVIEGTLLFSKNRLQLQEIRVRYNKPTQSCLVLCKQNEIALVLYFLITNAREAIHALEERWIEINVRESSKNQDQIEVTLSNSGPAIEAPIRETLFKKKFFTTQEGRGLGLGLTVAQQIIHAHGGEFSLDPSTQKTCFSFTLPKAK